MHDLRQSDMATVAAPDRLDVGELENRGFTVIRSGFPPALLEQLVALLDADVELQLSRHRRDAAAAAAAGTAAAGGESQLPPAPAVFSMRHPMRDLAAAELMAKVLASGRGLAVAEAALKSRRTQLRLLEQVLIRTEPSDGARLSALARPMPSLILVRLHNSQSPAPCLAAGAPGPTAWHLDYVFLREHFEASPVQCYCA